MTLNSCYFPEPSPEGLDTLHRHLSKTTASWMSKTSNEAFMHTWFVGHRLGRFVDVIISCKFTLIMSDYVLLSIPWQKRQPERHKQLPTQLPLSQYFQYFCWLTLISNQYCLGSHWSTPLSAATPAGLQAKVAISSPARCLRMLHPEPIKGVSGQPTTGKYPRRAIMNLNMERCVA